MKGTGGDGDCGAPAGGWFAAVAAVGSHDREYFEDGVYFEKFLGPNF